MKRLESLDALRGFDMLWIMGLSMLVRRIASACGAPDCWLARQMTHVPWEGFHHHDLIFPLFLFLAGCSWPFSLTAQRERGRTTVQIVRKILVRAAVLFVLGLVYFGLFNWDFAHLRFGSVIGRIGIAWAVAALCSLFFRPRTCVAIFGVTFFAYWAAFRFLPGLTFAPDLADPFSKEQNLNSWIDAIVRPSGPPDKWGSDGVIVTVGAVLTAFLGVFAGQILRRDGWTGWRKTGALALLSALCFAAYFAFEPFCPCIKDIWTSSFVLLAGALSFAHLAAFHALIDCCGWRRWAFFLRVVGMNSITIYLVQKIVDFDSVSRFFLGGTAALLPAPWQPVLIAAGHLVICWLLLLFLFRKQVFLRV